MNDGDRDRYCTGIIAGLQEDDQIVIDEECRGTSQLGGRRNMRMTGKWSRGGTRRSSSAQNGANDNHHKLDLGLIGKCQKGRAGQADSHIQEGRAQQLNMHKHKSGKEDKC